ncbi:MAG TPA: DUF5806 family protein [Methanocorpusculum sp.]|nr:DUF5806 family protein [Methanocorpusculum sp.]HJJ40336.1 DUF5806 family protein [Methanocorpusculum sp.]HJJ49747.1 DUF5806 family protein [Methanocorpusculum sp.]HJJ57579.1 DUF5806 family protein [Methanocorpusculum sp.]
MEEEYQNVASEEQVAEVNEEKIEASEEQVPAEESVLEPVAKVNEEKIEASEEQVPAEEPVAETPVEAVSEDGQAGESAEPASGEKIEDVPVSPPPKLKYYDEAEREEEINKYRKFKKVDGDTYRRINQFLRKRTYITAREWAIARLCSDFRTPYGAEMTFIGENLPRLCPFMMEPYSPQAVNQARVAFKRKVRKSAATFLYGAMCGFFTNEELDDILYEANEVARFILEIEGTTLDIDDEIDIEDKISEIMKKLGDSAFEILQNRGTGIAEDEEDDEDVVEVVGVEK